MLVDTRRTRMRIRLASTVTFGLLIGIVFGVWVLIATQLDPLADDTPRALLTFYGPMFASWGVAGLVAARRSGRLLEGIKVGATIAFVTFFVYGLFQFVRVNVFLDEIRYRADWHNLIARFERSGYDSLRWYVNYIGVVGAPFKLLVATTIGAGFGLIGGLLGMPRHRQPLTRNFE